MPNIFDGISKLSDADIRYQIAVLEECTLSNAFGQMGGTISNKTVSLFGSIRKAINGKETKVPEIITVEDKIAKKNAALQNVSRDDLEKRIRKDLIEKIESATSLNLDNPSDDRISVEVIELACKKYKKDINPNLTFAQKADIIRHRYDEHILSQMQEKLSKQNEKERRETEEAIQKALDEMSGERQEELRQALNMKELNGEVLRKLFVSTAGVSATLLVMETAGFGAYIALTTVIHAVFTTVLGITLPFVVYTTLTELLSILTGPVGMILVGGGNLLMLNKNKKKLIYELSAQIVWMAVSTYGHRFTPKKEELPSWLPSIERDRETEELKALHEMIQKNEEMKGQLEKQNLDLKKANETISENQQKIQSLNKQKDEKTRRLEENQKRQEVLQEEISKAEAELKSLKDMSQSSEEELKQAQGEIDKLVTEKGLKDKEINELTQLLEEGDRLTKKLAEDNCAQEKTISEKNIEIEELKKELENHKQKTDKRADKNAKELEKRWVKFFARIEFDDSVFKDVVKNFEHNEFIEIEMKLREIEDAKDPGAVSGNRGKVAGKRYHVAFSTASGFPSRIFYKATEGGNNGKRAIVTDIVKHNDSRYENLCR